MIYKVANEPEFIREYKENRTTLQKFIDKEEEKLHEELL